MILPHKDNLSLSDRLDIVHTYVRLGGHHGLLTELASDYNTNRQQIYSILRHVENLSALVNSDYSETSGKVTVQNQ